MRKRMRSTEYSAWYSVGSQSAGCCWYDHIHDHHHRKPGRIRGDKSSVSPYPHCTAAWLLASFCCGGKGLLLHIPALASPAPTVTQQANLYVKLFGVSRGAAFRKWMVILYIFFTEQNASNIKFTILPIFECTRQWH